MTRRSKFAVLLLLLVFAWVPGAWLAAEGLIVEKPLEKADAILVLGGSKVFRERTEKAADLYRRGVAPKIILTDDGGRAGWSQAEQRNPPFVELARKELIGRGVPPENIEILEPAVDGTIDEARLLQKKLGGTNRSRVLIVTSAYHTRRALGAFENVFAESGARAEIGIASAPPGRQTPSTWTWWLSPLGWQLVAGEYVKSVYYWIYY